MLSTLPVVSRYFEILTKEMFFDEKSVSSHFKNDWYFDKGSYKEVGRVRALLKFVLGVSLYFHLPSMPVARFKHLNFEL